MSKLPFAKIRRMPPLSTRDEFRGPLEDLFDSFFDKFFSDFHGIQPLNTRRGYPKVDVYREDKDLVFEAAVPGMKKDQLFIELDEGVLSIKGESQIKKGIELKEGEWGVLQPPYIKELKRSSFLRRFTLPSDLSINGIENAEAELEDGILVIRFKDAYSEEEMKPKVTDIPIK